MGRSGDSRVRCSRKVVVFKDIDEISEFISKIWIGIARAAIEKRNRFIIAISGGSTPQRLYQDITSSKHALPWNKTHIFLVDERFVPFDSPESNYGMIREKFLNRFSIPKENIHSVPIEESCQASAQKYGLELKTFFQLQGWKLPEFDLIMLGIGEDGHTASLFPGDKAIHEKVHLACAVHLDRIKNERITLTLPVINNARNVIFLVAGKNKANIIKEILGGGDLELPAAMVKPRHGRLFFLLDSQAASLLI